MILGSAHQVCRDAPHRFADLATLCSYLLYNGQYLQAVGEGIQLDGDVAGARRSIGLEELLGAARREVEEVADRVMHRSERPAPRFALERRQVLAREKNPRER